MKCDICGAQILNHKETFDTKSVDVFRGLGLSRIGTQTVRIWLCPACAQSRRNREVWLWIALGLLFAGMAIAIWHLIA
jgi:hypothetical protein